MEDSGFRLDQGIGFRAKRLAYFVLGLAFAVEFFEEEKCMRSEVGIFRVLGLGLGLGG